MERWITRHGKFGRVPKIDVFLAEIAIVCKKHGLSISHEDSGGGFLVTSFNEADEEWLMEASDARKGAAK